MSLRPRDTIQLPDGVTCDLVVHLTTTDGGAPLDTSFALRNLAAVPMMDVPEVAQQVLAVAIRELAQFVTREFRLMTAEEVKAHLAAQAAPEENDDADEGPEDLPA